MSLAVWRVCMVCHISRPSNRSHPNLHNDASALWAPDCQYKSASTYCSPSHSIDWLTWHVLHRWLNYQPFVRHDRLAVISALISLRVLSSSCIITESRHFTAIVFNSSFSRDLSQTDLCFCFIMFINSIFAVKWNLEWGVRRHKQTM